MFYPLITIQKKLNEIRVALNFPYDFEKYFF